jgi:small-conductance mechanosensitive channel
MKYLIILPAIIFLFVSFPIRCAAQQNTAHKKNSTTDTILIRNNSSQKPIEKADSTALTNTKQTINKVTKALKPPSIFNIISLGKIIWTLIFLMVGFYIIRIIIKIIEVFAEKRTKNRFALKSIAPIIRIFGWIIIIYIIIAGIFKPPFETLIAVTASIGIAVGLASQDILKNIFGGIIILFDRPFQVGDKIELDKYYGEVVKIGLRSTRIVTQDDSTVTIPNGELMIKSVSNTNFGESNCQVVAEIYLPISVNTEQARQIAIETAQVSKYIYLNKPIVVLFVNEVKQRRSYLKMRIKAYVLDLRYEFLFKSDMTEIVLRELLNREIISKNELF